MDSTFLLAALTIIVGAFVFVIRSLFASKCIRFQVGWGCIDVERDVDVEMQDIRNSPHKENTHLSMYRSSTPTQLSLEELEKEDERNVI